MDILKKKSIHFFNIIKFLYCSFVIGTGKERLLIRRKRLTYFSGNLKKIKKKNPSDREKNNEVKLGSCQPETKNIHN